MSKAPLEQRLPRGENNPDIPEVDLVVFNTLMGPSINLIDLDLKGRGPGPCPPVLAVEDQIETYV